MIEQNSENPEPLALDKAEVKYLLAKSGVEEEKLETFDTQYDSAAGEHSTLLASNIASLKKFEIKTPDITIQVNPGMRRSCRNTYYRWSEMPGHCR